MCGVRMCIHVYVHVCMHACSCAYVHVHVCMKLCAYLCVRDMLHQRPSVYSYNHTCMYAIGLLHIPIAQGVLIIDEVKVCYFLLSEDDPFEVLLIRWR